LGHQKQTMIQKLFFLVFSVVVFSASSFAQATLLVRINTHPKEAIIFIDGNRVEKEDGMLFLEEGKHALELKSTGYYSYITNIKVSRKNSVFNYTLDRDNSVEIPVKTPETETKEEAVSTVENEPVEELIVPVKVIPKTDKHFEMEMVDVVGGYFLMGNQYGGRKNKVHTVKLSSFMIGKYEVTQEQWVAIMGENPSKFVNDKNPVENVSWSDVQLFISRLNERTGQHYRLPTEAEWEYAARGGQKAKGETFKYSGSHHLDEVGWNWRNSGDTILVGRWDLELMKKNHSHPHVGGEKKPNSLGIYDMSGNVWEWCSDWYSEEYYANSAEENPQGPEASKARVYRGGSFVSREKQCTVFYRFSSSPDYGYTYLGFRLVLD